jgi:hypothetical protein
LKLIMLLVFHKSIYCFIIIPNPILKVHIMVTTNFVYYYSYIAIHSYRLNYTHIIHYKCTLNYHTDLNIHFGHLSYYPINYSYTLHGIGFLHPHRIISLILIAMLIIIVNIFLLTNLLENIPF